MGVGEGGGANSYKHCLLTFLVSLGVVSIPL